MKSYAKELINKRTKKTDWFEIIGSFFCVVGLFTISFLWFLFVV